MKKVLSIIFALVLMCCAVASVSAEISPTASVPKDIIIVDAIPVPGEAGNATPGINNPGKVEINSGEVVTLTATPSKGYKFSHWEFIFGEFEIIEGDLTTPTIVIRPTGSSNIRAEAHFVKIEEVVTAPSSKPGSTLSPDSTSPITGAANNTSDTAVILAMGAMILVSVATVVVLKKKANA